MTTGGDAPVGVLDSGLGGLSVLRALRECLPGEDFIYCADCGNAPWGSRPQEFVIGRCRAITDFLIANGAKALVLACNTATALAADTLRAEYSLPIIGIEPAVKPAARNSRTRRVGVLATVGTIMSSRYRSLVSRFRDDCEIFSVGAPGLMECVERGEFMAAGTLELVRRYTEPLFERGIDTLVLGCTHYPFLTPAIREAAGGRQVEIIDPAAAVAGQCRARLAAAGCLAARARPGRERAFIKGAAARSEVFRRLWPRGVRPEELAV